ncbi:hypothetical protein Q0Z83_037360 [Actinoplanes sichuanensis]|uniref:DUF1902 domain-containing protein n=1 Tax=Actinoplanes sichuanensis TaxID=512349 RepID=A0ABW4A4N2_9ACTN|nr:hypothetical protein [Actinoplanes sichuanensis]BEL05545.1 hypothetical protein Q0Z83_037360 [Actinoplanes sichuanensis]
MNPEIKYVLLYRTPSRWRISIVEADGSMGCGALPDTAPDVPAEVAQQDMLDHLRRHWDFAGELTWQETKPDWWAAEPVPGQRP